MIYSLFLTYQGLITENVNIVIIFSIWLVLILLFIGSTTYQFHLLKKPLPEYKFKKVKFRWFIQSKITRVFWFPIHLLQERPLLFIGSKFTSLLLLNIFFSSYLAGGYDERWLFFSITCSAYLNTMIWSEKASFEQKKLSYFLNMPLDIKSKIFNHHLVFLMILIPEFLIILYQSNYNVLSLFSLIAIALASNAGLYALFNLIIDENNFSRVIFFTFFLFFFLILFGIPAVVLILICYLPFMYLFKSPYQI
ncbi:hypothetical protein C9994_13595 [Marivirga lumbricoides]|uniref:Uncharacterized protein n=1 Tax=Marivirga lumbricoides TaxID=1046115 RepID=A0A2T4DG53_9BACT|nr:hypothetical protein C9994_13595 [Marivirga lumbricoides]